MNTYHLMLYGGGNSEIAASLEEEMRRLYTLKSHQLKVYAKTYIITNSGFAMYKRFNAFKNETQQVKSGGVYEYTYLGQDEGVTRQELTMGECSKPSAFRCFLKKGIKKLEAKEIILVLIGQSFGNGLIIDFFNTEPTQLTYKTLTATLKQVGKEMGVYFHLVLDIPSWHSVTLPYELSQIPCVASVFIWERTEPLKVFPVSEWLRRTLLTDEHGMKLLYGMYNGYRIQTHALWWKLCKYKWEAYMDDPTVSTWRNFFEYYRQIVNYIGNKTQGLTSPIQLPYSTDMRKDMQLYKEDIRDYLCMQYAEDLSVEEVGEWLGEMKNCVSYYKL